MKLTVIGCGYLGAVTAACLARLGHRVLGVDTNPDTVAALNRGRAPFFESGLDELLTAELASGRLHFTDSYQEAADFAEVHLLTVGTPSAPADDGRYDLSQVFGAAERLAALTDRPGLIIGKSTVPVGTAARLARRLAELRVGGEDGPSPMRVAWSPEFLREGHAIDDTLRPDRLVLGVADEVAGTDKADGTDEAIFRGIYAQLLDAGVPLIVSDLATAELAKGAANAFLAAKISFINAMAEVCEIAGGNIHRLVDSLALDPRIGPGALAPGIGFGGGCLPKDLHGFAVRAEELGARRAHRLLGEVAEVNAARRERVVELAVSALGSGAAGLRGRRIAIWGAAFKPGTDDVRDSPALDVAGRLHDLGARVVVHDPLALDRARKAMPHLSFAQHPLDAAEDADLLLHLTAWPEYAQLAPEAVAARASGRRLVDANGGLDGAAWRAAGWTCRLLGHG